MRFRSALLAATLLAAPLAAKAQPIPGLYVSGGIGANIMSDETIRSITPPNALAGGGVIPPAGTANVRGKLSLDDGFAGMASVGYSFGAITPFGGPRVELEGLYLHNDLGGGRRGIGVNTVSFGGNEQKYGGFVNAIWDFTVGSDIIFPYVGLGAGGLATEFSSVRIYNRVTGIPTITANSTEGSFAYQGIVGVSFAIPQAPGLSVFTDFRFEGLTDNRNYSGNYSGRTTTAAYRAGIPIKIGAEDDYNYTFLVGLKYAFNAAPPPPPPAPPAPAPVVTPSRSYLVFFDWDRYNLTQRARQIVAEAAQNSTRVQYTRIQVNGYTDTSGTPRYNQGLSIRRAQAVAAELVKDGVARSAISIQGFGETHLLVPTGPGVREPQNRRVEIVIQ